MGRGGGTGEGIEEGGRGEEKGKERGISIAPTVISKSRRLCLRST